MKTEKPPGQDRRLFLMHYDRQASGTEAPERLHNLGDDLVSNHSSGPAPRQGAAVRDLAAFAQKKRLPLEFLRESGMADRPGGGLLIGYRDIDGTDLYLKTRDVPGRPRFECPLGTGQRPYGLWRLDEARRQSRLFLAEGESDTLTLWLHGLPALGLPGWGASGCISAECLSCIDDLYICPDSDEPGEKMVAGVLARLSKLDYAGRVRRVKLPPGVKDVCDLHTLDVAGFPSRWSELTAHAELLHVEKAAPTKPPPARRNPSTDQGNADGNEFRRFCRSSSESIKTPEPFPTWTLPGPVQHLVEEGSAALGCDPALIALPALTACAAAIGGSRSIRLKRSWDEPSILWAITVAESGSLKTPAYDLGIRPVLRLQRRWRDEWRAAMAAHNSAMAALGKGEEEPDEPVMRQLVCSDITIETLIGVLEENPRGVLITRDELSGWFVSFTRYKGKAGGSDVPNYLELYSAGTIIYQRKTGEKRSVMVDNAIASVTGGIQPGILARSLSREYFDSGLAARLLMTMPSRRSKKWREEDISEATSDSYADLIEKLAGLRQRPVKGVMLPDRLLLSPDAKTEWVRWYDDWADVQLDADGAEAAAYAKIEGAAARLALVLYVAADVAAGGDGTGQVTADAMRKGIVLARYFAAEVKRIYAVLCESEEAKTLRRLVEWIAARPGREVTPRFLQSRKGYEDVNAARGALQTLVRQGLARWEERLPGPKGGRPSEVCVLIQTIDETDETQETQEKRDTEGGFVGAPEVSSALPEPSANGTVHPPDADDEYTEVLR